ncbi:2-polyprenyl-6-methoxyphenol hydroxylase [Amycolatopsis rubida]|uniref:2-polyprenyl-6-methoxyphenol hydroxylase n=2 Tax=Amycolatopsis rubida TaxID=112413 RepID=A0A1I5TLK9_9PSEU|nr:2-polyprenyl-6-methoxyphenol hydroxylase [Amycolatopsis rubida]
MSEGAAAVVGGGIGGLAAAAGLVRIGWRVTVLERAPALRELGAGMSLMTNAQRCLDELGVGAEVRRRSATMRPGGEGLRTAMGWRLMKPASEAFVRSRRLSSIVLSRRELLRVLERALPPGRLRIGAEVTGVDESGQLTYRSGGAMKTITADLVVAADGLNSTVRKILQPEAPAPVYSGHSVWRGITEHPVPKSDPGGNTWGRGLEFGRMPLADGRVYWYAVANLRPGLRHLDEWQEVRRRFGRWHRPIPQLIAATAPETVLRHDVYEMATPLPSFVSGRVVLLGDAAHAMTSDLGQGACQAIEDAVVLCGALATEPGVPAALRRYDEERGPRTQVITEASRRMGEVKLVERRLAVIRRNVRMRLSSPRQGELALARIGDWRPPALGQDKGGAVA